MDLLIPVHKTRKFIYLKFYDIYIKYNNNNNYNYSESDIKKMALNTERGIFNYAIKQYNYKHKFDKCWNWVFKNQYYLQKASTMYHNLNIDSYLKNTFLIKCLFDKLYSEFDIMYLSHIERDPLRWEELTKNVKYDNMNIVPKEDIPENGLFTCFKCKSTKTTYYQIQKACSDEGLHTYVRCVCGNRWNFR